MALLPAGHGSLRHGGYTSARFARLIPQPVLRGLVIVIGFGMAGWYFWKTSGR